MRYSCCINSFGGVRSNYIHSALNQKYQVTSLHKDRFVDADVKIFIYSNDLGLALTSQINRNYAIENYRKITNQENTHYKVDLYNWILAIQHQLNSILFDDGPFWLINTDYLDERKFKKSFGCQLAPFIDRRTTYYDPSLNLYEPEIQQINNFLRRLPKFACINRTTRIRKLWTQYKYDFPKSIQ